MSGNGGGCISAIQQKLLKQTTPFTLYHLLFHFYLLPFSNPNVTSISLLNQLSNALASSSSVLPFRWLHRRSKSYPRSPSPRTTSYLKYSTFLLPLLMVIFRNWERSLNKTVLPFLFLMLLDIMLFNGLLSTTSTKLFTISFR